MSSSRSATTAGPWGLLVACLAATHCIAQEARPMQLQVAQTHVLSQRGSTRATRYVVTNKIVTLDDKTHLAWLDSVAETMVATYDHAAGEWSDPVGVGTGKDNHGGPALLADSEGYLHIIFGPHVGPFQYAISAKPNASSEWIKQPTFGTDGTYPSAVFDEDDTLHIIYRGGEGGAKRLVYQRKPKGGSWSKLTELAAAPIESGYTHYHSALTIAPDRSLHVSYDIYFNGAAKCAGHLTSRDRGDSWELADGSPASLPVTPDQEDAFFKRDDRSLGVYNIACDPAGRPWISTGHLQLWHHDGDDWRLVRPALTAGLTEKQEAGAGGTLAIDAEGRLYWFGAIDREFWILYSPDGGETFHKTHIADPEPDRPLMGPIVERPTGHNTVGTPWLLYSAGQKGPDCYGHGLFHRVTTVKIEWGQAP